MAEPLSPEEIEALAKLNLFCLASLPRFTADGRRDMERLTSVVALLINRAKADTIRAARREAETYDWGG